VTLDYDQAASDVTQETYDPDKTVTLSMQRTEQTSGAQPVAGGVPGAASNAPNTQALPVYPQGITPPQTAKTESGTYGASKTDRHVVEGPGRVRRLTAAIVVNDRLAQPASAGKSGVWQPRSADELRNLTALAQAAVGFDPARGDALTVEDLPFDRNRSELPSPAVERWTETAESSPVLVKYVALFAGLLAILVFGVRPALRRAGSASIVKVATKSGPKELSAGTAPAPQVVLKPPEPAELDPERIRTQEIFEQVTEHLKREPTQSSRLLQSWIHSD
jgi:flagellar M-ring protein FliF